MREIILDTETTGMDPAEGHRLIEIGCVELVNQVPTGKTYHQYINPERDVPAEAVAVHGLTAAILKDKPVFSQIYTDFLEFIEGAQLVIHNAAFDLKFINAELSAVGHTPLPPKSVTDSLLVAREKFPGSPASLDALCRRFNIDLSNRTLHGALLDAQLLAEVWLELMGGRQRGLSLAGQDSSAVEAAGLQGISSLAQKNRPYREPRPHAPSPEEQAAHRETVAAIKDSLWSKITAV